MPIIVRGHLRITRVPGVVDTPITGRMPSDAAVVFDDHNLIVNAGMQVFSRMLGNNLGFLGSVNGAPFGSINEIAVGSMVVGSNPAPSTPAPTDTASSYVVSSPYVIPGMSVTYPSDTSIAFHGVVSTVGYNPAYGFLTEEALYLRNGVLFARVNLNPQVSKSETASYQLDHTFSFDYAA